LSGYNGEDGIGILAVELAAFALRDRRRHCRANVSRPAFKTVAAPELQPRPEPPTRKSAGRSMKIWEIITRLAEMAFRRKAIVDKLRALQSPINSHALKIIVYPDSQT
jgi:hypothetical protein